MIPNSVPEGGLRSRVAAVLAGNRFQHSILVLIIANAVILGLQTSQTLEREIGGLLYGMDRAIVAVFVVEILLRLYVYRGRFFRDPWSVFDFIVITTAMIPAATTFSVLRALRVLRVLRVVTVAPSMRRVVGALVAAIPGLGSIAMVLLLIFYVFAVIGTHLFGDAYPQWFGHVGRSLYTLFQVMTLESWSMGISRPVMETFPYAWAFFVPFILIATFTMLNLFIAVIVNATQAFAEEEKEVTLAAIDDARESIEDEVHSQLRALRGDVAELKSLLAGREPAPPRDR
ncbi:MAG: ion transporter [Caldimonas sp.]